mmetsp:Transcript_105414/g.251048  ORF Transcript_105414/g.251048 Transcript_105414/m.251048 type:complete len:236 (+) Transcript_105414:265-972(+)
MRRRRGRDRVDDLCGLGIVDNDMAIGRSRDNTSIVFCVHCRVYIGFVSSELLQRLPRFYSMHSGRKVEGTREQLRRVFGPGDAGDPLAVGFLVAPGALACGDAPDFDLAILGAGGEQLRLLVEGHSDHSLIMHHEAALILILEILPQSAGLMIPNLHHAIDRTRHAELAIRRECHTFWVRFRAEFHSPCDHGRAHFGLDLGIFGHASEHVNPRILWEKAHMLLPFHSLTDERQQP